MLCAGVMELADVSDSKSDGSDTVPVRPRSPAPREQVLVSRACFLLVSSFSSVSASPPRALASLPLLESHLRRTETPLRAVRACAERKTNRLKRKDLRSACVSKSQAFVSYSVPKGYAVIVARAIMMIGTCVERFAGAPIDYGQAAHINIVP